MTAAPDTLTIAFIGDLHGNMTAFEHTLTAALRLRVTTIIQAGDFWIYDQPHHPDNLERVITRVARNADLARQQLTTGSSTATTRTSTSSILTPPRRCS